MPSGLRPSLSSGWEDVLPELLGRVDALLLVEVAALLVGGLLEENEDVLIELEGDMYAVAVVCKVVGMDDEDDCTIMDVASTVNWLMLVLL